MWHDILCVDKMDYFRFVIVYNYDVKDLKFNSSRIFPMS